MQGRLPLAPQHVCFSCLCGNTCLPDIMVVCCAAPLCVLLPLASMCGTGAARPVATASPHAEHFTKGPADIAAGWLHESSRGVAASAYMGAAHLQPCRSP